MLRILAVDDDVAVLRAVERLLRAKGHLIFTADSGETALATVGTHRPDLILLDLQMGGIDGLETLGRLDEKAPGVPVIIMTGQGDVDTAVRAFKRGATDFVVKPFVEAKLYAAIDAIADSRRHKTGPTPPQMVGDSPRFHEALGLAVRFARPDINILISGETGTGKELFARTIHTSSKRSKGPYIPVDCSQLAEGLIESALFGHEKGAFTGAAGTRLGLFERADGGTIFLDEVENLTLPVQAKLLRVLQERTIERVGGQETRHLDVRVVSAANMELRDAVEAGTFRRDLYYRLAEAMVCPPPLRERTGDVRRLAEHFVAHYAEQFEVPVKGISDEALARLEAHAFPGNVRELQNVIKAAVVLATDVIRPEHLPPWIAGSGGAASATLPSSPPSVGVPAGAGAGVAAGSDAPPPSNGLGERFRMEIEFGTDRDGLDLKALANAAIEKAERTVLEVMVRQGHSQVQLARLMNIDPKTLRAKLRKYGLDAGPG